MSEPSGPINEPHIIRTTGLAPAHDPEAIVAYADMGIDAVGLDFEDLTPADCKEAARQNFAAMARELRNRGKTVMARTNALGDGGEADLEAIVSPELHCLVIPKCESAQQVVDYCAVLEKEEERHGLSKGYTLIRPCVETAKGIRLAFDIASASDRVTYMGGVSGGFWGDLGATLGLLRGPDGEESSYLRAKVLLDVRAAGVRFPIGGGSLAGHDPEAYRTYAWQNKRMGYTGHYTHGPKKIVDVLNEVYSPTMEELEQWGEVLPGLEKARDEGLTAYRVGDVCYDTAGIQRVREQFELARRIGMIG